MEAPIKLEDQDRVFEFYKLKDKVCMLNCTPCNAVTIKKQMGREKKNVLYIH